MSACFVYLDGFCTPEEATERIAQLEQLDGLTLALEITDVVELNSEQRHILETLRTEFSVRQICETLDFNKSTLYYQLRKGHGSPAEEKEQIAAAIFRRMDIGVLQRCY